MATEYQSIRILQYVQDSEYSFLDYDYFCCLGTLGYNRIKFEWRDGYDGWGLYCVQYSLTQAEYDAEPAITKPGNTLAPLVARMAAVMSNVMGLVQQPPFHLAPLYRVENVSIDEFKVIAQMLGSEYIYDDIAFIKPQKVEHHYAYERNEDGSLVENEAGFVTGLNAVFAWFVASAAVPIDGELLAVVGLVGLGVLTLYTFRETDVGIPTLQVPIDSWQKIVENQPAQEDWNEYDKLRPLPFVDIMTIPPDEGEEPPEIDQGIRLNAYIKIREVLVSDDVDGLGYQDSFYVADIYDMNGAFMATVDWEALWKNPPIAYDTITERYLSYKDNPVSLITASNFRAGNNLYIKVITLQDDFINNLLMWDNAPFLVLGQMKEEASVLSRSDVSEIRQLLDIEID